MYVCMRGDSVIFVAYLLILVGWGVSLRTSNLDRSG